MLSWGNWRQHLPSLTRCCVLQWHFSSYDSSMKESAICLMPYYDSSYVVIFSPCPSWWIKRKKMPYNKELALRPYPLQISGPSLHLERSRLDPGMILRLSSLCCGFIDCMCGFWVATTPGSRPLTHSLRACVTHLFPAAVRTHLWHGRRETMALSPRSSEQPTTHCQYAQFSKPEGSREERKADC